MTDQVMALVSRAWRWFSRYVLCAIGLHSDIQELDAYQRWCPECEATWEDG